MEPQTPHAEQPGAEREEPVCDEPLGPTSDPSPVLRVRRVTGDVVLSLSLEEAKALSSVLALRAKVAEAVSRSIEEVALVAGLQQLQDAEPLEVLLAGGAALEVVLALQHLPPYDPSASPLTQLPTLKGMLFSPHAEEQLKAARIYREMLSVEHQTPIDLVIEQGVVPRFLELCEAEDPLLQYESAWALTNVASGNEAQTHMVVDAGGVPVFVHLLQASSGEVREQAAWALGNIGGDSCHLRDRVLQGGALQPFLRLIEEAPSIAGTRVAVWAVSNLCRGKPPPDLAQVAPALTTLVRTLGSNDVEVMTDSAHTLSYVSESSDKGITAVLDSGVLPQCVELLSHPSPLVLEPVLRTVGNILSGGEDHRQQVLSAGVLSRVTELRQHAKKRIRLESYRVISHLLAGSPAQIQDVIDAGLVQPLVHAFFETSDFDFEVKVQVAKALANVTTCGSEEQIHQLVQYGCVRAMVAALDTRIDEALGCTLLDGLEKILNMGERVRESAGLEENPWAKLVIGAEGVEVLQRWAGRGVQGASLNAQALLIHFLRQAP